MFYSLEATGKRIKDIRNGLNMSQEEFALSLNITRQYLSLLEIGKRSASIDLLVDISIKYDVSLDYLILGKSGAACTQEYKQSVQKAVMECLEKCL